MNVRACEWDGCTLPTMGTMSRWCIEHARTRKKITQRRSAKVRYEERKAAGICVQCGARPADAGESIRCSVCRADVRRRSREYRMGRAQERLMASEKIVRRVVLDLMSETGQPVETWNFTKIRSYGLILAQMEKDKVVADPGRRDRTRLGRVFSELTDDLPEPSETASLVS